MIDPDMRQSPVEPPRWVKWVAIGILVWVMIIVTALVAAGIAFLLGT